MSELEYAILNREAEYFMAGMTREEMHSYVECEAHPADIVLRRVRSEGGAWRSLHGTIVFLPTGEPK